jgi:hypothetical protein
VNVCVGGTCSAGVTSITFTNSLTESVTITSCTMPGWPNSEPVIPAAQNGVSGSGTVQLSARTTIGDYSFTTDPACNTMATNPKIKVQ